MKLKCILESQVTFDRQVYPSEGQAVFIVGIPGAGKSEFIKNYLPLNGKWINPDILSEYLAKKHNMDLSNPEVTKNMYVQSRDKFKISLYALLNLIEKRKSKPNLIFEATGKFIPRLEEYVNWVSRLGYKVTIVYLYSSVSDALRHNLQRTRKVKPEDIVDIDEKLGLNLKKILMMGDAVWLVGKGNDGKPTAIKFGG